MTATDERNAPPLLAYAWWFVVGALLGLGVAGLLSIGPFCLVAAGAMAAVGSRWRPLRNHAALAVPAGASVIAWYLAWLNHEGPGEVCHSSGFDSVACTEEWTPWPFVAVGCGLVAVSVVLIRRARRAESHAPSAV